MASDRVLKIRFESESEQFKRDIAQVDRSFTGLLANIKAGIAQGVGQQITGTALGAVAQLQNKVVGFGREVIAVGSNFEQTQIAFKTFLGSAEKAKKVLDDLVEFSASTPFELPEVQAGARNLLAFGVQAENLIPTLKALGDVSSGVSQPLQRLVTIYGQVLSKGRLQGEELLQFSEAGVPLAKQLATQLGVTEGELQKLVSSGKVGFEDVRKAFVAMTSDGGKFFNLMQAQAGSVSGKISNLNDQFTKIKIQFFEASKPIIGEVVDLISSLATGLKNAVETGAPDLAKAAEEFKKQLEGSPEIAQELGEALGEVGVTLVTDLVNGAQDLASYLRENPDAIEEGIDKAKGFAAQLGTVLQLATQIAAKLAEAASKLPDLAEGAAASGFQSAGAVPFNAESLGVRKSAIASGVKPETFDKEFEKRVNQLGSGVDGFVRGLVQGDPRAQAAEEVAQRLIDATRTQRLEQQKLQSQIEQYQPTRVKYSLAVGEATEKAAKKGTEAVKKSQADQLKDLTDSRKEFLRALDISEERKRTLLLESLVRQGKDLSGANAQFFAIEQQSLRDRLAANKKSIAALNKSKAGASKDDIKKINSEIESLEADSFKVRGELAKNSLDEIKRIEGEKQEATQERVRKQQETEQKALESVKESQSLALDAVKQAETQRAIAISTALNKGLITEEQANAQRLDSRRKELNDELSATKAQVASLEALPKFSDPEKEKQRQNEIRAARAQTSQITLQLLENERSKQEQQKNDLIKGIERASAADKNRSDRTIANLDKEKAAQDLILASIERQNKLINSRLSVIKAQNNLEQVQAQNNIDALKRAQEIRKQLDDGSITDANLRTALEKELRLIAGNSALSQLELLKRRQAAEDQLIIQQAQNRATEQAAQRAALESEITRNKILSDRAVLESKIAEIRAKQQLADAEVELQKSQIDGDKQKIANAQKLIDLAKQGVDLAAQNVTLSGQQVADQAELAANSRQQLNLEQQATVASAIAANRTRENAQTEELVRAGGTLSSNRLVDVSAVSPIIPERIPLIPAQSPLAPVAQNKFMTSDAGQEFKTTGREILNQLRLMNNNFQAVARSPKVLNLSSPEPVSDVVKVLSDLSRMNIQSAGL